MFLPLLLALLICYSLYIHIMIVLRLSHVLLACFVNEIKNE